VARSDPSHAKRQAATLGKALDELVKHREELARAHKKSAETAKFYAQKAKNWTAFLGENFPLASLDASHVESFISSRRAIDPRTSKPFVTENTIHKELVTLRAALKRAKILGMWKGDVGEIIEPGFASGYEPRQTFVPDLPCAWKLIEEVERDAGPGRAAVVAFSISTGAEWSAIFRARKEDVAEPCTLIPLHGTKRRTREREVPIILPWQKGLLAYAVKHADGVEGALFLPWPTAHKVLSRAARRAATGTRMARHLSFNDLRRTYGKWLRGEGISPALVAPTMGHASSAMVEKVYGELSGSDVAEQIGEVISLRDAAGRRKAKSNRASG
jgi:integrase